jgi:nucleoside-diphosphate kinase
MERTLIMIKPDAVARSLDGKVLDFFIAAGMKVVAVRKLRLTPAQGGEFYKVHRERPFYKDLVAYISSGPLIAVVLEGEGAVPKVRELMGATNPANAAPGTIRALWGESIERNAVHGSDSPESAAVEIPFFFTTLDLLAGAGE